MWLVEVVKEEDREDSFKLAWKIKSDAQGPFEDAKHGCPLLSPLVNVFEDICNLFFGPWVWFFASLHLCLSGCEAIGRSK